MAKKEHLGGLKPKIDELDHEKPIINKPYQQELKIEQHSENKKT